MSTVSSISSRSLAGIPTGTSTFTFRAQPTSTDTSGGNNNGGGNGYNSGNNGNGGVNSTLYLFTFLTTLLLLLAVSCGIVVRSFILRRRFHRRVEEAIAAGVLLPGQTGDIGMGPGGTINVFRRHIGEKPKMWEVWIDERSSGYKRGLHTSEWPNIQPVAATQISDAPPKPKSEEVQGAPPPPPPATMFGRIARRLPFRRPPGRNTSLANATPTPPEVSLPTLRYGTSPAPGQRPPETSQTPKNDKVALGADINRSVQVAVLIAMPDPSKPRYVPMSSPIDESNSESGGGTKGKQRSLELPPASAEEHELPEICIGITHAQITEDVSTVPPLEQPPSVPKA